MRYLVTVPVGDPNSSDPQWLKGFVTEVEARGFDGIVVAEHAMLTAGSNSDYPYCDTGRMPEPPDTPFPDALSILAFAAACTNRITLGTGVLVLPIHHPVILAKRAATVDRLSQGRLRLGIGLGWSREEITACGAQFETRGARVEEQIELMRNLWSDASPAGVSHFGRFFHLSNAVCNPKPLRGNIPIDVGGHSPAAAARAGRLGDGFHPLGVGIGEVARLASIMRDAAIQAGRDPTPLCVTLRTPIADVHRIVDNICHYPDVGELVLQTPVTDCLTTTVDYLVGAAATLGLGSVVP